MSGDVGGGIAASHHVPAPDAAANIEPEKYNLHFRAQRGIWILGIRLFLVQALTLPAGILLARQLGPAPFGLLAMANAIMATCALLGDLGLGAALINKRGRLSEVETRAVLTIQLLLAAVVAAVFLFIGATAGHVLFAESFAVSLVLPIVAAHVIAPFRAIAIVILDRHLLFGRVAVIELVEHLAFYVVALALGRQGLGVFGLAVAILARSLFGATLGTALSPWRPCLTKKLGEVRSLIGFGLAQQSTTILYTLNGLALPVLVGRFAGETALGLTLWAYGNAERPKSVVIDIVARVTFPFYSRLRPSDELLRRGLERALHGSLLLITLYGGLLCGTAPALIPLLYKSAWLPGIPLMYVFSALLPFASTAILLDSLLFARGEARVVRNLHILRLGLLWTLALPTTWMWSANGFAVALALATVCCVVAQVRSARRFAAPRDLLGVAKGPFLAGTASAATSRIVIDALGGELSALGVGVAALAGAMAFGLVEGLFDRMHLRAFLRLLTRRGRP
jgi:PST family polysaccharide transporter